MTRYMIIFLVSISFSLTPAQACTVAAETTPGQRFLIAKNFDWLPSEGFIVTSPMGQIRQGFFDESLRWKSRYSSLSFTTLGPGLPISSMNDQGLVVETLVDFDSDLSQSDGKGFASLDWAQYVLDNFATLEEVIHFSQDQRFDQVVVPLHFFICDRSRSCGVFEMGQGQLNVTRGKDLSLPVLANRGWSTDKAQLDDPLVGLLSRLPLNPYASQVRFRKLARGLKSGELKSVSGAFRALNRSKIDPLVQWQIVWQPETAEVSWREFNKGKPGPRKDFRFSGQVSCDPSTLVRSMKDPSKTRPFTQEEAKRRASHIKGVMLWHMGRVDKPLTQRLNQYMMTPKCENI